MCDLCSAFPDIYLFDLAMNLYFSGESNSVSFDIRFDDYPKISKNIESAKDIFCEVKIFKPINSDYYQIVGKGLAQNAIDTINYCGIKKQLPSGYQEWFDLFLDRNCLDSSILIKEKLFSVELYDAKIDQINKVSKAVEKPNVLVSVLLNLYVINESRFQNSAVALLTRHCELDDELKEYIINFFSKYFNKIIVIARNFNHKSWIELLELSNPNNNARKYIDAGITIIDMFEKTLYNLN
ncbi:MAG TPA: hypothetical protein GXX74_08175 [Clostridiales bacterium]|nr:hypothetical protein [Clostridiales bacterium]